MVKFRDNINADLLQKTIEQLAVDIGLNSSTSLGWVEKIEDDYPDSIEFDPEFSSTSIEEYAEFKVLSEYTPEQTLLIKRMVLLDALGGDFSVTINAINNLIIQGFEFYQIMDYLLDRSFGRSGIPKYISIMLTNTQRPDSDIIKKYLESRSTP